MGKFSKHWHHSVTEVSFPVTSDTTANFVVPNALDQKRAITVLNIFAHYTEQLQLSVKPQLKHAANKFWAFIGLPLQNNSKNDSIEVIALEEHQPPLKYAFDQIELISDHSTRQMLYGLATRYLEVLTTHYLKTISALVKFPLDDNLDERIKIYQTHNKALHGFDTINNETKKLCEHLDYIGFLLTQRLPWQLTLARNHLAIAFTKEAFPTLFSALDEQVKNLSAKLTKLDHTSRQAAEKKFTTFLLSLEPDSYCGHTFNFEKAVRKAFGKDPVLFNFLIQSTAYQLASALLGMNEYKDQAADLEMLKHKINKLKHRELRNCLLELHSTKQTQLIATYFESFKLALRHGWDTANPSPKLARTNDVQQLEALLESIVTTDDLWSTLDAAYTTLRGLHNQTLAKKIENLLANKYRLPIFESFVSLLTATNKTLNLMEKNEDHQQLLEKLEQKIDRDQRFNVLKNSQDYRFARNILNKLIKCPADQNIPKLFSAIKNQKLRRTLFSLRGTRNKVAASSTSNNSPLNYLLNRKETKPQPGREQVMEHPLLAEMQDTIDRNRNQYTRAICLFRYTISLSGQAHGISELENELEKFKHQKPTSNKDKSETLTTLSKIIESRLTHDYSSFWSLRKRAPATTNFYETWRNKLAEIK